MTSHQHVDSEHGKGKAKAADQSRSDHDNSSEEESEEGEHFPYHPVSGLLVSASAAAASSSGSGSAVAAQGQAVANANGPAAAAAGPQGDQLRHRQVSLSSKIHHNEEMTEVYMQVLQQPWGFSFLPRDVQARDVDEINGYIDRINRGNRLDVETVSHRAGTGEKIEYTVAGGRCYSTHEDSAQLYPIGGPGVFRGNGAVDMYRVLKARGLLTEVHAIRLSEGYDVMQSEEYKAAAAKKLAGGHRSGVQVKVQTTPAGNIRKMRQPLREKAAREAGERLEALATSPQFGLGH